MIEYIIPPAMGFFGLFVRGFAGFGSALIMTPILLFIFDIKTTVVLVGLVETPASLLIALNARKEIDLGYLKILVPVSLIGVIAGGYALARYDPVILKKTFGIFTIIFTLRIIILLHLKTRRKKQWPRPVGYLAGLIGGLMSGLFGTSGPPIAVYLENQIAEKDTLRATMLCFFLINDVLRLIYYGFSSLITLEILKYSIIMLPATFLGAYFGRAINLKVNNYVFRLTISIILLITGILLLSRK